MNNLSTTELDSFSAYFPKSPSERQLVILDFMKEYESAEEYEKMRLLQDFEMEHANFFEQQ